MTEENILNDIEVDATKLNETVSVETKNYINYDIKINNEMVQVDFKLNQNLVSIPFYFYRLIQQIKRDESFYDMIYKMLLKLENNNVQIIDVDISFEEVDMYVVVNTIGFRYSDTIYYFVKPFKQLYRLTYMNTSSDVYVKYSKVRLPNVIHEDPEICFGNLEVKQSDFSPSTIFQKIKNAIAILMLPNIDSYYSVPFIQHLHEHSDEIQLRNGDINKVIEGIIEENQEWFNEDAEEDSSLFEEFELEDICNNNEKCIQYAKEHYEELF